MKLFDLDTDNNVVKLNKAWIMQVPEFAALIKRDKGGKDSPGDYDGRRKLQAIREFTFIYFYCDFASPITDWEDSERRTEALYYAGLTEVDDKAEAAREKFEELQLKGARALRTYKSLLKAQDATDAYFETLDYSEKSTRTGELLNTPDKVITSITKLDKMYDTINAFRKRVENELKEQDTGIRGMANLGDQEGKVMKYSEADVISGSEHASEGAATSSGSFDKLLSNLQAANKLEIQESDLTDTLEGEDES